MVLKSKGENADTCLWVYMLVCNDGSLYTGMSTDLQARLRQHQQKTARCKFTRRSDKHPLRLGAAWRLNGTRGNALSLEIYIKGLNRVDKQMLLNEGTLLNRFLERDGIDFPCEIIPCGGHLNNLEESSCSIEN